MASCFIRSINWIRFSFLVLVTKHKEKKSSLNFTELFKNCEYRYFGNEVKENLQNFVIKCRNSVNISESSVLYPEKFCGFY